jgi:formylglycine-generating enzyme required for sulfatase activity
MAAGGYDDPRWWVGSVAADWRMGIGTAAGIHDDVRLWVERYRTDRALLDATYEDGSITTEVYERWQWRATLSEEELTAHLEERYPSVRHTEPQEWANHRMNHPSQPVVGISFFEARAYCAWLTAQTGQPYRLPTDSEFEAAAMGLEGRDFPWGGPYDPERVNGIDSHVLTTTPIGVYPEGDSPEGITDLSGNVEFWTSTLPGPDSTGGGQPPELTWTPKLEDSDAPLDSGRVVRGGSWLDNHSRLHPTYGVTYGPTFRPDCVGLRLARDVR